MTTKQIEARLESAFGKLDQGTAELTLLLEEVQGWFDDHSEAWQASARGTQVQEFLTALEEATDALEGAERPEVTW